jgi:uncharacterized RDD family membrane protein YckC
MAGAVNVGTQDPWEPPASPPPPAPAPWWPRVGATIVDGLIILAGALAAGLVGAIASEDTAYTLGGLTYFALLLFYAPVLLATNGGRTWGKQLLGVRVLRADGTQLGFGRGFCRESLAKLLFSLIPFMWLIDVLWPLWQDENKALHDLIAGTRPVEAQPGA